MGGAVGGRAGSRRPPRGSPGAGRADPLRHGGEGGMSEGERLAGRCVLITGASEGFGYALARACLQEGARVMICARSAERVGQAVRDLGSQACSTGKIAGMPADISRAADVERLVA